MCAGYALKVVSKALQMSRTKWDVFKWIGKRDRISKKLGSRAGDADREEEWVVAGEKTFELLIVIFCQAGGKHSNDFEGLWILYNDMYDKSDLWSTLWWSQAKNLIAKWRASTSAEKSFTPATWHLKVTSIC